MSDNKKKKKKVVYYDDGRTIADMSGLYGKDDGDSSDSNYRGSYSSRPSQGLSFQRPGSGIKDQIRTYFNTVKLMLLPMLVTLGIISVTFLILWILLELAS